jgi:hypothetical protein
MDAESSESGTLRPTIIFCNYRNNLPVILRIKFFSGAFFSADVCFIGSKNDSR